MPNAYTNALYFIRRCRSGGGFTGYTDKNDLKIPLVPFRD